MSMGHKLRSALMALSQSMQGEDDIGLLDGTTGILAAADVRDCFSQITQQVERKAL